MIKIELNSLEEAIHIHNIAALNTYKFQNSTTEANESQQNANLRIWQDIFDQAVIHIEKFAAARGLV